MRQFVPRIPHYIVAVVLATIVVSVFHLDQRYGVATIESRFAGGIPQGFPKLAFPHMHFDGAGAFVTRMKELIPSAATIALFRRRQTTHVEDLTTLKL